MPTAEALSPGPLRSITTPVSPQPRGKGTSSDVWDLVAAATCLSPQRCLLHGSPHVPTRPAGTRESPTPSAAMQRQSQPAARPAATSALTQGLRGGRGAQGCEGSSDVGSHDGVAADRAGGALVTTHDALRRLLQDALHLRLARLHGLLCRTLRDHIPLRRGEYDSTGSAGAPMHETRQCGEAQVRRPKYSQVATTLTTTACSLRYNPVLASKHDQQLHGGSA